MQEPLETRYLHPQSRELQRLPDILFLLVLSACSDLAFDRPSGKLVRQSKNASDGGVLAVGLTTLLRQLPNSFLEVMTCIQLASHTVMACGIILHYITK
jgi:hypothetical protein